jgi:hypothetical protein
MSAKVSDVPDAVCHLVEWGPIPPPLPESGSAAPHLYLAVALKGDATEDRRGMSSVLVIWHS